MTATEAAAYLKTKIQRVYDALGNRGTVSWTLTDAAAIKALLEELARR